MIFWLFGLSEGEKKAKGKKEVYLVNDIDTRILK